MADDSIIVGKLDSSELEKSIEKLVKYVGNKTNDMAASFTEGLDKMKLAMKDFAITQKVSVDLMQEAWKKMSTSFDAMVAAQSGGSGSGGSGGHGGSGSGTSYPPNTIGALEQEISAMEKRRKEMKLFSDELKQQNLAIENQRELLSDNKAFNTRARNLKEAAQELRNAMTMPTNSLAQAEEKMRKLQEVARRYPKGGSLLDTTQWNRLQNAIDQTQKKIEKLNQTQPTLKSIKGMSEKSVDDIAAKLKALRSVQIDPKNAAQVRKLGDEYQRLTRLQNELLGRGIQLTKSNNYLAQSFGYIRNRIVYAMTLGAVTNFTKQIYDIRSQYELLERSLGVLIGSFERGSQIFQELNTMALKSPFTLMELGTAAKQLTAYNFKANEVVETTRRLADLSAALGVPMERLTYNLGQIRAQTVLTARDARDFANAGLPIVKSLADHYSELEGRMVTTGEVYTRMSKKAVSYNDVMVVLNKLTDEGGKFFDFQAKQAETLRVQMANLTLAWNNMLNDIGKEHQGALTAPIHLLKSMFQNWQEISHVLSEVVVAIGLFKGSQLVINKLIGESSTVMKKNILANKEKIASDLEREAMTRKLTAAEQRQILNKKKVVAADYQAILSTRELSKTQAMLLVAFNKNNAELIKAVLRLKLLTRAEIQGITLTKVLGLMFKQLGVSILSIGRSIALIAPQLAAMFAIGAIVEAVYTWSEVADKIKEINRGIVESAKESMDSLSKYMKEYKEVADSLYEWETKNGKRTKKVDANGNFVTKDLGNEEAAKVWERMKEEIELSSAASETFISKLMAINDINDRIRMGFDYVQRIHDVNGALQALKDDAIDVNGDWSKWWNLWTLPDGLIENLKDYTDKLEDVEKTWGNVANAKAAALQNKEGAAGDLHDLEAQYETFSDNLKNTVVSMYNAFESVGINTAEGMREAFERSNDKILADGNLSSKEQLQYRMAAEEEFINHKLQLFNEEYEFEVKQGNIARANMVAAEWKAWKDAFGGGQAVSEAFFNWLKNQHSSEINAMFGNMKQKELDQLDWSQPKWQKWAQDNAESFSKQYGVAFDKLKGLVADANTWKIFLKLFITTDEKSVYDTLKDADAAANAAWSKMQRLKQRQAELNRIPAANLTDKQNDEAKNIITEIADAQRDYNDALSKGGHASKQQKEAAKGQKTAEQELTEALRQELSVIREIQGNYDKMRKAGVSNLDAINAATQGYGNTLEHVNKVFQKYGISKFNAEDFAGKDVNAILETLKRQQSELMSSGKLKAGGVKEMDVEIQKLTIDAKNYNMDKVTKGLNNELGKLKDEYELAVELDANPELGDIFADMMGLSKDKLASLPRDFNGVMTRLQEIIDSKVSGFNLAENLNKANLEDWIDNNGIDLQSELAKQLTAYVDYANKVRKDETVKQISEWDKLLEKYAEYEYKRKQILDTYERDMAAAIKRGASQDIIDAITNKRDKDMAQLDFERFQQMPEWVMATGEISTMTEKAIGGLIKKLEEYKKTAKNLDAKQIKQINNALKNLYKEQRKNNPFKAIGNVMDLAKERFDDYQTEIDAVEKKIEEFKKKDPFKLTNEEKASFDELQERWKELKQLQEDASHVDTSQWISAIKSTADVIMNAVSLFDELAKAISGAEKSDLDRVFGVVNKAFQGAQTGSSFGTYGAIIGAVIGAAAGIVTEYKDVWNGNVRINKQLKISEQRVKLLTTAYNKLQHQVDEAYGDQVLGAKKLVALNKQQQLAELERQLELEKSRVAKDRDLGKITELEDKVNELKYEVDNATREMIMDILDISDSQDWANSFVKSMIEAFRQGEDYMKTYDQSFEDMINSMITKAIMGKVIGDRIEEMFENIKQRSIKRGDPERDEAVKAAKEELEGWQKYYNLLVGLKNDNVDIPSYEIDRAIRGIEAAQAKYQEAYNKAVKITPEDVASVKDDVTKWRSEVKSEFEAYMDAFGVGFGSSKEAQSLSNLQQGIQGVTETTASAVEAYMNGVSQQSYLHSELLTEIRDAVVSFNMDVQLATMSQMLLQLQESYQVQMAIQTILAGWSAPNGLAVRVQMVS